MYVLLPAMFGPVISDSVSSSSKRRIVGDELVAELLLQHRDAGHR